jgi:hypothetical protein
VCSWPRVGSRRGDRGVPPGRPGCGGPDPGFHPGLFSSRPSGTPWRSRPFDLKSRPFAHLKSRPFAHLKSRPFAHLKSRPFAHLKSRPFAHLKSRPFAHLKSRPFAHLKSRPFAHLKSRPFAHLRPDGVFALAVDLARHDFETLRLFVHCTRAFAKTSVTAFPALEIGNGFKQVDSAEVRP